MPIFTALAPDEEWSARLIRPAQTAFHSDLRRLLAARGWSAHHASLEAGLGEHAIGYYLERGSYPRSPDDYHRLATALGAPAGTGEAWLSEAKGVVGPTFKLVPYRRARRRADPPIEERCAAPGCGRTFRHRPGKAPGYCSAYCKYEARASWLPDTALKRKLLAEIRGRRIRLRQAAAEMGVQSETLRQWLKAPEGRLRQGTLAPVATWLGITMEDAVRLQGGTAEDRQREIGARAARAEGFKAQQARLEKGGRLARRLGRRGAEARAERYRRQGFDGLSDDHKERISHSLKRYHQNPDRAYKPGAHNGTLRGRARHMLGALRRFHPEIGEDELKNIAVERLLQSPYEVGDEQVARDLLVPKRRELRASRPGPRPDRDRCRALRALLCETGWRENGRAPHRFDVQLGERTNTSYRAAREWRERHLEVCRACSEAIATARKIPRITG